MTCPNWHPVRGNGHCDGTGLLEHRNQWVPCPSCWAATGRPALNHRQTRELRRYHVLLIAVTGLGTDQPDRLTDACRNFDHTCAELGRLGVDPYLRHAWIGWVESHAGTAGMTRLRTAVLAPAEGVPA